MVENKNEFNASIEARKMQEAVANMLAMSSEYAKGVYGLYKSFRVAGFNEGQALYLIGRFMSGFREKDIQ